MTTSFYYIKRTSKPGKPISELSAALKREIGPKVRISQKEDVKGYKISGVPTTSYTKFKGIVGRHGFFVNL